MTSAETFSERVAHVHAAWTERRELKALHGKHDLPSQLCLLDHLRQWMLEAAQTVRAIYGTDFPIHLDTENDGTPSVAVTMIIGDVGRLFCSVAERPLLHGTQYRVDVRARTSRGSWRAVGPERRLGYWSRPVIEEIVLEAIAAYERAIDDTLVPLDAPGNVLEILTK